MPDFEDLVILLAGIHITDRKRERAVVVAGHLVADSLRERWHKLSAHQRERLIRASANRLWDNYMMKRRYEDLKPKDAARNAIVAELATLNQLLNPVNPIQGLEQMNDS